MEFTSTLKDTWKIFIIGSLIGGFMLLLFLNENDQISSLSNAVKTTLPVNFALLSGESNAAFTPSMAPGPSIVTAANPPSLASMADMAPNPSSNNPPSLASMAPNPSSIATDDNPPSLLANMIVMAPTPSIIPNTINNGHIEKPNVVDITNLEKLATKKVENKNSKCDIYDGRWVYKPDAEPSYCPLKCPFIEEKMSCKRNGRPDLEYEKWVWEATHCDIPLLNGTDMVERFRNKRIVLIGDSLNRNMWESLACIMYSNIPYASSKAQILFEDIHIKTFLKAKEDYNFTVEFYWSPLLVEVNKNHESGKKVLRLERLSRGFEEWIGADVMIFNTGHHWTQIGKKRAWDLYEYKGKLIKEMPLHQAYTLAMRTWSNWIERNVDPKKTSVFFRSISSEHISEQYHQHCYSKTQPIKNESYKSPYPKTLIRVVENVIRGMRKHNVRYLNITKLTDYRIDAHPSIYRNKDWKILTRNHKNKNVQDLPIIPDCGHWCLPGIPDTWNRLLYASLFFSHYI